jgi:hypothetical protein
MNDNNTKSDYFRLKLYLMSPTERHLSAAGSHVERQLGDMGFFVSDDENEIDILKLEEVEMEDILSTLKSGPVWEWGRCRDE